MSRRIQMAETIRGHSVDVLISRQKLITRRIRSARAACGSLPRPGQTQGQTDWDSRQSRRPRYLDQEWSFLRDRVLRLLPGPSRGKKVPSPSVKMYLTVGELGEGFAACLRRGHPSQVGLTGKPTTVTQGKKGCLAIPQISCRPYTLFFCRGSIVGVEVPEGRSWEQAPTDTCFVCGLNIEAFLGPAKQKISLQAFLEVIFSVAMALILPLLLKDQVGHSCFSSSLGWFH